MLLRQNFIPLLISTLLLGTSNMVQADVCAAYAKRSVTQQEKNVFDLCGFRGSLWSNDFNRWHQECQTMSSKDLQNQLLLRDNFLANCPEISYPHSDGSRQSRLQLALLRATEKQDIRLLETLINEGVNLASQPKWLAASSLYIATTKNDLKLARLLVTKGAKPYLLAAGEESLLSLLLKQEDTNYAFFEFLLKHKANPNVPANGKEAEYPLVIAAAKGDYRAVALLLDYKVNPNLYVERSALQLAVEQDHYPITRALIKHGANPNLGIDGEVCNGKTALDIAFRTAKDRIIDLLLDNNALSLRECKP